MRQRPNIHYFTLHGTDRGFVRVPVRVLEADSPKKFARTQEHVRRGVEGKACTCAHSVAALEQLGGDAWEFSDNRAYQGFKNRKGQLYKAIVFEHNQGDFQRKYDRLGKRAMLNSPECEAEVVLNPPPKYTPKPGPRAPYAPSSKDGSSLKRRRHRAIGSLARLLRNGVKL